MRLNADLAEWARTHLGEVDQRTALVELLLSATRERRLAIFATPLDHHTLGDRPEEPALVCFAPQ